ncbi:DUF4340 domain-containing protein [bacterium]|nr:DUF4340 domain-containing protein [bacterium]
MSARLLWVLSVVIALAALDGSIAWKDSAQESERPRPGRPLVSFSPGAVFRMKITRAAKPPLVLVRSGEGFVLESSHGYPVNQGRVEVMLARFLSWTRDRVAGEKTTNHALFQTTRENGIAVRLETASGSTVADLVVGGLTGVPLDASHENHGQLDPKALGRYVRLLPEESVYVVSDFVTGELEPDPAEWIERPIVKGDPEKVTLLAISRREGSLLQIAFGSPYARLLPEGRPVDPVLARELVSDFLRLSAQETAQDDGERNGLASPRLAISALFSGEASAQLVVGADLAPVGSGTVPRTAVHVPGKPSALLVPTHALRRLVAASSDSVALSKVLGERSPDSVTRAELRSERGAILASREAGAPGWTVRQGPLVPDSPVKPGKDALAKLDRLRAAVVGLSVAGFDAAGASKHGLETASVRVSVDSAGERREIVFGSSEDGRGVTVQRQRDARE